MSVCLPASLLSLSLSSFSISLALCVFVCVYENQYHAVYDTTIPNSRSPLLPARLSVSFALLYKVMLALSTCLRVLLVTHQILKAKTAQDECRQSLDQNQVLYYTLPPLLFYLELGTVVLVACRRSSLCTSQRSCKLLCKGYSKATYEATSY